MAETCPHCSRDRKSEIAVWPRGTLLGALREKAPRHLPASGAGGCRSPSASRDQQLRPCHPWLMTTRPPPQGSVSQFVVLRTQVFRFRTHPSPSRPSLVVITSTKTLSQTRPQPRELEDRPSTCVSWGSPSTHGRKREKIGPLAKPRLKKTSTIL